MLFPLEYTYVRRHRSQLKGYDYFYMSTRWVAIAAMLINNIDLLHATTTDRWSAHQEKDVNKVDPIVCIVAEVSDIG
jgi:hypothetical protein